MTGSPVIRTVTGDVGPDRIEGTAAAYQHLVLDARPLGDRDPDAGMPSIDRVSAARVAGDHLRSSIARARTRGIGLVVEATPPGAGRDPVRLADVSAATGVAIVACTGAHAPPARLARIEDRSAQQLAEWFSFEISNGIAAVAGDCLRGVPILSERGAGAASDALNDAPVRAGAIRVTLASPALDRGDANLLEAAALAARANDVATFLDAPPGTDLAAIASRFERSGGDRRRLVLAPGARTPDDLIAAGELGIAVVVVAPAAQTEGAVAIWQATVRGLVRLGIAGNAISTTNPASLAPAFGPSANEPPDGHRVEAMLEVPGIDPATIRAISSANALRILATHR